MMRKINPTVKLLAILAAAVITAFGFTAKWNLVIVLFCLVLMLFSKVNIRHLLVVMIPATLAALSLFFAIWLNGKGAGTGAAYSGSGFYAQTNNASNLSDALGVGLRMYAYAFLGMLFALTTDSSEFIYSLMQQLKVKPKFAYGVLAAFHLLPVIRREYSQIRLAYRVRGYRVTPLSLRPAFSALVNTMHWSESLAMAMESKGFEEEGERTFYLDMKVRPMDFVFAAALIAIAVCGVLRV